MAKSAPKPRFAGGLYVNLFRTPNGHGSGRELHFAARRPGNPAGSLLGRRFLVGFRVAPVFDDLVDVTPVLGFLR